MLVLLVTGYFLRMSEMNQSYSEAKQGWCEVLCRYKICCPGSTFARKNIKVYVAEPTERGNDLTIGYQTSDSARS